jgi:signal transduction histidine kinase
MMRAGCAWTSTTVGYVMRGSFAVFIWLPAVSTHAAAEEVPYAGLVKLSTAEIIFYVSIFFAITMTAWAFVAIRKLIRQARDAKQRVAELEILLNDSEVALAAEPHILIVWRGRDSEPERISGDMRGTVAVPAAREKLLDFADWFEAESAAAIQDAIIALRERGTPFNIGIRTKSGDLLEADGRTAGGLATLRLRPVSGERRQLTELAYDARKLGKQVERLSAVLDGAPLPIWLKDEADKLIWVNNAYIAAVEAPDVDSVIRGQIPLLDPAKLEPAGHNSKRGHVVIGGAKRALDVYEVKLPDDRAGYALDVTRLEEAQKELKRHLQAQAGTLDKLDTAIAIFGPDQRLRFHNTAYTELWGFDTSWLATGPSDSEILDQLREQRKLPEQANYRNWKASMLQVYTTLEPRETLWYLPDGRTLHVIGEQHPFGGVTYLYENVTKEIQLESRYNELIGVQRETLDNLHEGLALFGSDGCLRLFNPAFARIWALDANFLNTQPHVDHVIALARRQHSDDAHWDEIKYGVTGLDTRRKPLNGRLKRADGVVLEFASVPLPDGNTLLTYVDVTDSSRIEAALRERTEALEAADRIKTGFMSKVSYELRTPLTSIIGFSESLSLGIAGELQSKQHEYLRHIQTSSQDLLSIIDAILDLTTVDAGAMQLNYEEIDTGEMLKSAAEKLSDRLARHDLSVTIEVAENAAKFSADRKRVSQILNNLLTNAIGFSQKGGSIRAGAHRDGDDLLLWVSDTGSGIDPDFQDKVFERFQSRPAPGSHRGAGLGLAIVKSFVELHHGKVSLHSRLGKGTTVVCRLPADGHSALAHKKAS